MRSETAGLRLGSLRARRGRGPSRVPLRLQGYCTVTGPFLSTAGGKERGMVRERRREKCGVFPSFVPPQGLTPHPSASPRGSQRFKSLPCIVHRPRRSGCFDDRAEICSEIKGFRTKRKGGQFQKTTCLLRIDFPVWMGFPGGICQKVLQSEGSDRSHKTELIQCPSLCSAAESPISLPGGKIDYPGPGRQ